MKTLRARLLGVYRALLEAFGPQHWWPADTPFEVMVGAVLTQNTAWRNVERAIGNLKRARLLTARALATVRREELACLIRPAGYFNQKAARLQGMAQWLVRRSGGSVRRLFRTPPEALRRELLSLKGIGPETADSILLYAGGVPVFVVDAYTRRVFSRHGFFAADLPYERIRAFFERALPADAALFNEYHALLVRLGKNYCRPRPQCAACPVGGAFGAVAPQREEDAVPKSGPKS